MTMLDSAFVWDDYFVTKLATVDDQHHALVDLFNELNRALFSPAVDRDAMLADVYGRLLAYTEYHFGEEEALMVCFGLDERHVQSHRQMHRNFVDQLSVLWAQRSTMTDPGTTLVGFLTSWLGLHILGIDQSMARQIHSIEHGLSPADAFESEKKLHDEGTQALLKMIGKLYNVLSTQNTQLALINQSLEERVVQRTRDLQTANERLRTLSRTDALLGIANRAYFNERLEQACTMARRQGWPVGLVMIDVDEFKNYNDHYGHLQGDMCLQAVAHAVGQCMRRSSDLLARYGGEELVVILPDTDAPSAQLLAQRMVQAVRDVRLPHAVSQTEPYVTISAGVHSAVPHTHSDGSSASAWLIARADTALYEAKKQGRNRCVLAASASASAV